jgi:hypothetical protein
MRIVHPPRTNKAALVGADALARFPYCVLWIDPRSHVTPSLAFTTRTLNSSHA